MNTITNTICGKPDLSPDSEHVCGMSRGHSGPCGDTVEHVSTAHAVRGTTAHAHANSPIGQWLRGPWSPAQLAVNGYWITLSGDLSIVHGAS